MESFVPFKERKFNDYLEAFQFITNHPSVMDSCNHQTKSHSKKFILIPKMVEPSLKVPVNDPSLNTEFRLFGYAITVESDPWDDRDLDSSGVNVEEVTIALANRLHFYYGGY